MNRHGHVRITASSPEVVVANPRVNLRNILGQLDECADSDVVVFPELCITGYTCGDLFRQKTLLDEAEQAVYSLAAHTKLRARKQLVFVGAPVRHNGELFNCAIAINRGNILGVVPKQHVPNYGEFYEKRWFESAGLEHQRTRVSYATGSETVPFGINLLFAAGTLTNPLTVLAEVCEDLFMPIPPSSIACMYGANVIVNLSASPQQVAKDEYVRPLITNQSGRCLSAYAYAGAGPSESTTDLVFSGHCVIAENGNMLAESTYVGDGKLNFGPRSVTADIDIGRLETDRTSQDTFGDCRRYVHREYQTIRFECEHGMEGLKRHVAATPFVPTNPETLAKRAAAVFDIQCAALAKRIKHLGFPDLHLGVSGGLDSTHVLLVAHKTLQSLGQPVTKLKPVTLPGFGTTQTTKGLAHGLMDLLGLADEEVDIRPLCMQMFRDIGHKPFGIDLASTSLETFNHLLKNLPPDNRHDLTFENVQARARTFFLMSRGFVLGTGDMSEAALGWSTYGGDHMSMYGVNFGVPKTLIRFLVSHVAEHHYKGLTRQVLNEIAGLTISPELLPPGKEGEIVQSTEQLLGPYVLHDFFLFNFARYGFGPEKIEFLAAHSELAKLFPEDVRKATLRTFLKRFFDQQFKRTCVPDGPKVGTLSLSPRGDWRMPTDASSAAWLEHLG